jgi:hypothetical protein
MWTRTGPDRDTEVERKRQPHDDNVECCLIHGLVCPLLVHAELLVDRVHAPRIEEDQEQEDEDRSLLGKPEAQIGSAHFDAADQRAQQDAKPYDANAQITRQMVTRRIFAAQYALLSEFSAIWLSLQGQADRSLLVRSTGIAGEAVGPRRRIRSGGRKRTHDRVHGLRDLTDLSHGGDGGEGAAGGVVVDQRRGIGVVGLSRVRTVSALSSARRFISVPPHLSQTPSSAGCLKLS